MSLCLQTVLWCIISHERHWPKADLAETSELYDKPLEFFCQEFYYVYCIWLQWIDILFTTKVCPSFECTVVFCLVVFLHATDIIACASDETGVVDETSSRLIRPTSEVLDRVDVSLWF